MTHTTLQEYWKHKKIPGINGITFADGRVLKISNRKCQGSYDLLLSSIERNEKKNGEIGAEVEIYIEKSLDDLSGMVICGACEMGNEGFILYQDKSGIIAWSLFQDFANPFLDDLKIVDGIIYVSTEIQYYWKIPLLCPEKISCVSKNEWGY